MIKISKQKKGPYLNGPYGPYIKYNGPYSGPYAVPTVPTAETGRNELCALVTTAHLHCMRTGKCHLNLAYLGSLIFCCFGDHVVYTYYCFAETRLV